MLEAAFTVSFVVFGFTGGLPALFFVSQLGERFERQYKNNVLELFRELNLGLEKFHLMTFSVGYLPRLSHLKRGTIDGVDVAVFDYQYVIRESPKSRRTRTVCHSVVWQQRRRAGFPEFFIRPTTWHDRDVIEWVSGRDDINFQSHPTFSRAYLLSGDAEHAIRELFTDDVLAFYEQHGGRSTESAGNNLIYYRDGVSVGPARIQSLLQESLQLLSLFQ